MSDEMINKTSPLNAGKTPGIKETIDWYDEYDMNVMNDPIDRYKKSGTASTNGSKD